MAGLWPLQTRPVELAMRDADADVTRQVIAIRRGLLCRLMQAYYKAIKLDGGPPTDVVD